jgi:hypothetical protein
LDLPKHSDWCQTCQACDMVGICRSKPAEVKGARASR